MVNTPQVDDSGTKKVSSLIKSLRRENYRNQIMPSRIECQINSCLTPSKIAHISNQKWGTFSKKKQYFKELENKKVINAKDLKIATLETKISQIQKENSELREMLNKFIVMRIEE